MVARSWHPALDRGGVDGAPPKNNDLITVVSRTQLHSFSTFGRLRRLNHSPCPLSTTTSPQPPPLQNPNSNSSASGPHGPLPRPQHPHRQRPSPQTKSSVAQHSPTSKSYATMSGRDSARRIRSAKRRRVQRRDGARRRVVGRVRKVGVRGRRDGSPMRIMRGLGCRGVR